MKRKVKRVFRENFGGCRPLAIWILIALGVSFLLLRLHRKDSKGVLNMAYKVIDAKNRQDTQIHSDSVCGMTCLGGQKSFYIKTGTDKSKGPTICYDGKIYMSEDHNNVGRGLNMVFIDGNTHKVVDMKTFDTYVGDQSFKQYAQMEMKDKMVVILASFDEMTYSLKDEAKTWLKVMGSSQIDKVAFRDSYLLIGQRGLKQGQAVEFLNQKGENGYGEPLEKKGCFPIPMGDLEETSKLLSELKEVKLGSELVNCGLEVSCEGTPLQVFTGDTDNVKPHICVGGRMVMEKELNNPGRGFNIVVLDKDSKKPKFVSRFDTYEGDSKNLEEFLKELQEGDIVVAVVNDDASKQLREGAIEEIKSLGSSAIQNLGFRDVWYFVGQKGIEGYTELEEISYATYDGDWPKQIKTSVCLPTKLKSLEVAPKIGSKRNLERREFCKANDGYSEFCDTQRVDELLIPAPLKDKSKEGDEIFKTPILIIPGLDHNALARTLETTLQQPGIQPDLVTVAVDEQSLDQGQLATLFKFQNISLGSVSRYEDKMNSAIKEFFSQTKSTYVIVIEEEIVLTPDFLNFLSQCLPALAADDSLFGISAFNYNGFETTSGDKTRVNRMEDFPGLAFLLKRTVYESQMKTDMEKCCKRRSWDSWTLKEAGEMLVPDVSRVFRLPYQSASDADSYLENLFYQPRLTISEYGLALKNIDTLKSAAYETELKNSIKACKPFPLKELQKCASKTEVIELSSKGSSFVIYFADKDKPRTVFHKLCKCFGLYSASGKPLKGLHKGSLRFIFKENTIFLIPSTSPYFEIKAADIAVYEEKI
ncbi:protein O-linked-mannose beta-1,2-N-acetylglucosaminyltransferase 1-like isoform X2 [Crassostrea virginica]